MGALLHLAVLGIIVGHRTNIMVDHGQSRPIDHILLQGLPPQVQEALGALVPVGNIQVPPGHRIRDLVRLLMAHHDQLIQVREHLVILEATSHLHHKGDIVAPRVAPGHLAVLPDQVWALDHHLVDRQVFPAVAGAAPLHQEVRTALQVDHHQAADQVVAEADQAVVEVDPVAAVPEAKIKLSI